MFELALFFMLLSDPLNILVYYQEEMHLIQTNSDSNNPNDLL